MTSFVVDANVLLALLLPDERIPPANMLDGLALGEAIAPAHCILEVANGLLVAKRRGRITTDELAEIVLDLDALHLALDNGDRFAVIRSIDIANAHGLTVYDAAYLELALRMQRPLATFDRGLRSAAAREHVLFGEETSR